MKKLLFFCTLLISTQIHAQKQKVWLDADTGNEMDDVYAIVRLLWAKDQIDIVGLSSAHFNNPDLVAFEKWNQYPTAGINTVKISQGLNEEILATMGLSHIPHPIGADRQMGRAWGGSEPRPSAATDALLAEIKNLKPSEKLDILILGAVTNIASLIALDSTVKTKIRLFSMGQKYYQDRHFWSKNDFNSRCDFNAIDFLFNQTNLDWTIITNPVCMPYKYEKEATYAKLDDNNPVEMMMQKRWEETNPQNKTRILWDLALVQAYLLPQFAEVLEVMTPPDNHQHKVKIYSKINIDAFNRDFWETVEKNRKN
jgi:inosine-uridine nucleoside N-ribohydrolase